MWQIPARDVGARALGDGRWQFRVWAPTQERLELHLLFPTNCVVALERESDGYFTTILDNISPATRYMYRFADGRERPDPASRFQPEGVHGPSQVSPPFTGWTDDGWSGIPLHHYLLYEIHVGTFSPGGTFDSAIPYLDDLVDLGVTAVEVMPIAQFPGTRNWGYDGVDLFAVQASYGGPEEFARFVDACHARQLAVVLDVVYNHVGPEGNYLGEFGPYFTDAYKTPWGAAINFDGPENAEVRSFFLQNARMWVRDFHVDALRLDAVHAIMDMSPRPFLTDLAAMIRQMEADLHRRIVLFAESDANDPRVLDPPEHNGSGIDAQWSDEFHHAVHTLLTGETTGYYADFGRLEQLGRALTDTFVFAGDYSEVRRRPHGASVRHLAPGRFVFSIQNHDQVGNRAGGERLGQLVSFQTQKLAAGLLLLAPSLPLIFMGEEYGEPHPFLYFVDHGDPALITAVREGRRAEFFAFGWPTNVLAPDDLANFTQSKLDRSVATGGQHASLRALYRTLLHLRHALAPLRAMHRATTAVDVLPATDTLVLHRWEGPEAILAIFHLGTAPRVITIPFPLGHWRRILDSADSEPGQPLASDLPNVIDVAEGPDGPGAGVPLLLAPRSFVLFAATDLANDVATIG